MLVERRFPNSSARGPLLALKNNHRSIRPCSTKHIMCPDYVFLPHSATAHSGPEPPNCRRFTITLDTPHSIGNLWMSDQPDAVPPT